MVRAAPGNRFGCNGAAERPIRRENEDFSLGAGIGVNVGRERVGPGKDRQLLVSAGVCSSRRLAQASIRFSSSLSIRNVNGTEPLKSFQDNPIAERTNLSRECEHETGARQIMKLGD